MRVNPELQRNIWLEVSPHRLIVMPLVLGLVFTAIYLTVGRSSFSVVDSVSMVLFLSLTSFWGAKRAAESVAEEVAARTWDNQRMSVIAPWTMTWGKLLGVTIFPWYGGVICLAVWLLFASTSGELSPALLWKLPVFLSLFAIFVQALAFTTGVMMVRKGVQIGPRRSNLLVLFLAITFIVVFPFSTTTWSDPDNSVLWYKSHFAALDFSIASLLLWGGWTLVGAYRVMRRELQFTNGPGVWWGFLAVLIIYVSSFAPPWHELAPLAQLGEPPLRILLAFFVVLTVAYFMLLTESKDAVVLRLIAGALQRRHWQKLLENLPCWALSLPVIALLAGYLLAQLPDSTKLLMAPWFALSLCLFFVRDASLFVFLNIVGNKKHADTAALIYLGILYVLIPILLVNLAGKSWLLGFFLPTPAAGMATALIPPILEIGLLVFLMRSRLQIP